MQQPLIILTFLFYVRKNIAVNDEQVITAHIPDSENIIKKIINSYNNRAEYRMTDTATASQAVKPILCYSGKNVGSVICDSFDVICSNT